MAATDIFAISRLRGAIQVPEQRALVPFQVHKTSARG